MLRDGSDLRFSSSQDMLGSNLRLIFTLGMFSYKSDFVWPSRGIICLNLRFFFLWVCWIEYQFRVHSGYFGLKSQVDFYSEVAGLNIRFGFTPSMLRIHPKLSSTLGVLGYTSALFLLCFFFYIRLAYTLAGIFRVIYF